MTLLARGKYACPHPDRAFSLLKRNRPAACITVDATDATAQSCAISTPLPPTACEKRALLAQCAGDIIVSIETGRAMHSPMKFGDYVLLNARGRFPHCETAAAMQEFLDGIKNLA